MANLLNSFSKLDESGKASLLDYLDFLLKKQAPAVEDVKPVGKRGRPWKVQAEATDVEVVTEPKRGRGRPKKAVDTEVAIESPVKGKRGRPKKEAAAVVSVEAEQSKKGRGRPKKEMAAVVSVEAEQPKKGRGRPKKAAIIEEAPIAVAAEPKKGRGRPRKIVVAEEPIVIEPVEDVAAPQIDEPAVDAEPSEE